MKTYGDIITRIAEIINLSVQEKENVVDEREINQNFVYITHHYISATYIEEYKELLELERIFYAIEKDSDVTKKNIELMNLCQERINDDALYQELYDIINSSFGLLATNLKEYNGYLIAKEQFAHFLTICRKLQVGPLEKLKNMDSETAKMLIDENLRKNREQEKRINKHLEKMTPKEENIVPIMFNDKFRDVIELGINGKLTLDMVATLRNSLSREEYDELLIKLELYSIFSHEELHNLDELSRGEFKTITTVDELVEVFAQAGHVRIDDLKILLPVIGRGNFNYMIDQLFVSGVIDIDDYINDIEKMLNKDKDEMKRKLS